MKHRAVFWLVGVVLSVLLAAAVLSPRVEAVADPYRSFSFVVEISGLDAGPFQSVEGLGIEQEVIEYRNGTENIVRKLPGRLKYQEISLKRGYRGDTDLSNWIESGSAGAGSALRRSVSISIMPHDKSAGVRTFTFHDCFPIHWGISPLIEGSPEGLTEEIVLTCDTVQVP